MYANDAFGTAHRAEATTEGIARFAPVARAGPLMAGELEALGNALGNPEAPAGGDCGGSKVSTKLTILDSFADKAKVDQLIVGGGIANTFLKATGAKIGKSLAEADLVDEAKKIIDKMAPARRHCAAARPMSSARKSSRRQPLPQPKAIADVDGRRHDPRHWPAAAAAARPAGKGGHPSCGNGPVGAFEFDQFAGAPKPSQQPLPHRPRSIAGGGDTIAAINHPASPTR